jgi:hypothetical protein
LLSIVIQESGVQEEKKRVAATANEAECFVHAKTAIFLPQPPMQDTPTRRYVSAGPETPAPTRFS